ncbi:MAG: ice-binding family protein [Gallionella sp.]
MKHTQKHLSASLIALVAFLTAAPMAAWAATAPSLGTASSFAALSGAGLTCTGSAIVGDVGSLLSVTGFPGYPAVLCTISGTVHAGDQTAITAHSDLFGASGTDSQLTSQACDHTFDGVTELSGPLTDNNGVIVSQPLSPGVYCFSSAATLGGTLNLTGGGTYIFRTGTTLTTGATAPALAQVLVNGAQACDAGVFWQIGSSATIGSNTSMVGDVLANQSITFTGVNTSLVGGAFANVAAITMTGTSIAICGGTQPPPPPPPCKTGHNCDGDHDGDHDNNGHHDHDGDHDNNGHHDHDGDHDNNGHHNGHDDHDKCNQGVGNGPEGCDPGHSAHNNPFGSNDENDGNKPGNPGRKGGKK